MAYNNSADSIIYREVQKFNQIWVWLIVIAVISISWYGAIEQFIYGRPFGNNPLSDQNMLITYFLTGVLLPLFLVSMRLVIEIRNSGIYVKFFPIHLSFRHYSFENLASYDSTKYRPLRDYGGWGIRRGSKGKAYTVKGNRGVLLEFLDGKRLLIGSQEPDVLKMSIEQGRNRN